MNFVQLLSLLFAALHGVSASAFFLTAYSDVEFEGGGAFYYNNLTAYESGFIVNNRTTTPRAPVTVSNSTDLPSGIASGGHLEMDVSAPGGQQVYVQADGLVRYTASGSAVPAGSFNNLFTSELDDQDVAGPEFKVGFNGTCGPDQFWCSIYACALSEPDLAGFYQVYAPTATSNLTNCIGFRMAGGEEGSELAYTGGIAAESY